jgi:hypothetical protein
MPKKRRPPSNKETAAPGERLVKLALSDRTEKPKPLQFRSLGTGAAPLLR